MTLLNAFTKNSKILMLAFDHRGSFKKMMEKGAGREVSIEEIVDLKKQIIKSVASFSSGILIDQDYGLPAYQQLKSETPLDASYVLPMEKTGYTDAKGERITELLYSAESLVTDGAKGAKLLLYTNPQVPSWATQLDTARTAIQQAQSAGLPMFLEFVLYDNEEVHAGTVVENVTKAIEAGIKPDVWKVAYPGSRQACKEMTQVVGDTPWILLTGGDNFDVFKEQYKEAVEEGASGFLAGRALWKEACDMHTDKEKLSEFLANVLPERFNFLVNI